MNFQDLPTLLHWIREREAIRIKKVGGMKRPWTKDPILQSYRFCNVRRQDDAVTIWLREHWYKYHEHPNFVGAITLARLFNEPTTLYGCEFPDDWHFSMMRAKAHRDSGARTFNPAYIVSTCGEKMDKVDYVFRVAQEANKHVVKPMETLASFADKLMTVRGLGSGFLAAQVIADLKYTPLLEWTSDWSTWCLPGPGSQRGLSRLVGLPVDTKWQVKKFQDAVNDLRTQVEAEVGFPLHAQDMQNCLCEYSKYKKAQEGGRPKQNYPGGV